VAAACANNGDSSRGPSAARNPTEPPAAQPDPTPLPAGGGTNNGTPEQPEPPPPPPSSPPPPPPSTPATYVRGSLKPIYQLLPRSEYGRVKNQNVQFQDADYQSNATTTSAASKMDEIAAIIQRDSGSTTPIDVMPDPGDRQRSQFIPFRGKPSDVKMAHVGGLSKLYVPLGGDVMTVGNQVAVINVGNNNLQTITQIQVGVRPQRIAVHPTGLVFVCNQYSNYISIIDPRTDLLLTKGNAPVEIPTEYMCADLAFAPKNPRAADPNRQFLYVANRWRHSVLKYDTTVVLDSQNRAVGITSTFVSEILGVGNNPWRLALSDQQDALFVANNKGGEVARVSTVTDKVTARIGINAPSADVVNINDLLFVPTECIDRGLLANDLPVPQQVNAPAVTVTGLDQKPHIAHPGAMFDRTRSYNFEDLRNGLMQLDANLTNTGNSFYYTDDVSSEPNFVAQQKVLAGAEPTAIARNAAGTIIFMAMSGSQMVQELHVNSASRPNTVTPSRTFKTKHRPFAITLDEPNQRLFVADWGSDVIEQIDLRSGRVVAEADPGFASPPYPATSVERGELFFYDARWSNNERKSCATCHFDELDTDGVGYSNGATAPTAYHQVKPNHNLTTTHAYFWNGSFSDGNYTSLAFGAQTRGNCQLIEFGFIEGPGSDPKTRVGDKNNLFKSAQDSQCRPITNGAATIANQAAIDKIVKAENAIADQKILAVTGVSREELSRQIDSYSVAGIKLYPNPLRQTYNAAKAGGKQLDSATVADIAHGKEVFSSSGCASCHQPDNAKSPYADGLNHGSGADWVSRFVSTYQSDPRIINSIGTFSQTMLDSLTSSRPDHEINIWNNPLDFFVPFCFDVTNCLQFDDPLQVRGGADETRRLDLLIKVNLADPDRGFVPGSVPGQAVVNTPSLRGVWMQANLLHHGLAHTIREAILAPGHPLLQPGETGFAIDATGTLGVHGATQTLSEDDVRGLVRFVESIE
jgi:cytochrome c551/c552/6-phosphogluconolactonase (cycloisomerase 2 family)